MIIRGYVYAIQAVGTEHVKIGYSANPARRLASLRTGSPVALELIAQAPAPRMVETHLHELFTTHGMRLRGEWFDMSPIGLNFVREIFAAYELAAFASTDEDKAALVDLVGALERVAA